MPSEEPSAILNRNRKLQKDEALRDQQNFISSGVGLNDISLSLADGQPQKYDLRQHYNDVKCMTIAEERKNEVHEMEFPVKIEKIVDVRRVESGSTLQKGRYDDLEHSGGKSETPSSKASSNQVTRSKKEEKKRSRSSNNSAEKKQSQSANEKDKDSKSKSKKRSKKEKEIGETQQAQPSSQKEISAPTGTIEPNDNPDVKSEETQAGAYKSKKEFKVLMKTVEERRLKEVRLWILANSIIFLVTAPSLHYYRWERMDYKGQAAIVIQSSLQVPITIALVASFLGHLEPVYPLVLLQGVQTILYNYLSFDKADT